MCATKNDAWDDVSVGGGSGDGIFMKLGDGKHTIRLAGAPKLLWLAWHDGKKYAVTKEMKERLESLHIAVRKYYAINCFDRADTAKGVTSFKIIEKGPKLFNEFKLYRDEFEVDPGSDKGPDFRIIVKVPEDKRRTDYKAVALKSTPFSEAERELIARTKESRKDPEKFKSMPLGQRGLIDLDQFYKIEESTRKLEEIIAKAAGLKPSSTIDDEDENQAQEESIDDIVGGGSSSDYSDDAVDELETTSSSSKKSAKQVEEDIF